MKLADAKCYDGRSPVAKLIEVHLHHDGQGIELRDPGGASTPDFIPFGELKLDAPIGRGPWAMRLRDGRVVECPAELYDQLTAKARPSLGARISHRAERSLKIAVGCFIFSLVILLGFFQFGIPFLAGHAVQMVPPEVEQHISKEVMRIVDRIYFDPSKMDAEQQDSIRAGFAGLASRFPDCPDYEILFRSSKIGPNAFALPGGVIVMTDELVDFLDNPEQVYGVLAHELGHIHHRHGLQAALQAAGHAVVLTVFLGDVTSAMSIAAAVPTVLFESGHSRRFEREADTYATHFALKTGLDPAHLIDALEKLTQQYGDGSKIVILSTHPPTPERVNLIRSVERSEGELPHQE